MNYIALTIAVGILAAASPARAICLADGEYEQALEDVRQRELAREQADGGKAGEATRQDGAGQTETADAIRPATEPRSTN